LIAWAGERPVGYGNLCWESDYEPFRLTGVPEINNLGVDAAFRRQGIATTLIHAFEDDARQSGRVEIGVGVGLYAGYGNAQRLYWRLGYRPDGRGITYDGRMVSPGELVRLDDDLILWLSKPL
jgi:ribosomal protein S18 acetylase RimI-like enzyme